jgi:hypothetical protein
MELAKQMWEMKLNDEIMMPDGSWFVTRVPGGWIYRHNAGEIAVFVPLDNEFARTEAQVQGDEVGHRTPRPTREQVQEVLDRVFAFSKDCNSHYWKAGGGAREAFTDRIMALYGAEVKP